ncbi:hypothetical protein CL176_02435 [Suicoccus acidiformans]|uniref:Transposase IS66 central domain-containing protein n=1 Tax=Suicoccus acidiformans TaxID=2036206 RepID=A0A347WIR7_9LACT|nr:hypothetical protein CL176_02435 [Suicoccus acidiformans]
MYEALLEHLLQEDIIHADETSFKVIESTKKSYYWLLCSGRDSETPIIFITFKTDEAKSVF